MVSVNGPLMRHGHKRKSLRFDGHKAAADTQLITAVDVLPGNALDNLGALELVEQNGASAGVPVVETLGDTAYGNRSTRQAIVAAGRKVVARRKGSKLASSGERTRSMSGSQPEIRRPWRPTPSW